MMISSCGVLQVYVSLVNSLEILPLTLICCGCLDGGAVDTTASTMTSFLLQMVRHPGVQIKAQIDIDRVTGRNRLPTLAESVCLL